MYKKPSKTKQPESETHAYEYCMFLLNIRLRSEGELRYGMIQRGYVENVIEQVINRLFELKYIDDNRFLEILVDNNKKYKNYGYMMIKKKLIEKRLSRETIESGMTEYFSSEDELAVAKRFIKKEKLTTNTQEDKQKLVRKLQARGFRMDAIMKVVSVPLEQDYD